MAASVRRADDLSLLLLSLQFQLDVAVPRTTAGTWSLPTTQALLRDAEECVTQQDTFQASQAALQELSTREHQVATEITRHEAKLQDRSVELQLVRLAALAKLVFDRQRLLSLASIVPQQSAANSCGSTDVSAAHLMSDTLNSVQFHAASVASSVQASHALPRRDPVFAFHFVFNSQCRPEEDLLQLLRGFVEAQKQHQQLMQQHREIVLVVPIGDHVDEALTFQWIDELFAQLKGEDISRPEGQTTSASDREAIMLRQWQVAGFRWSVLGVRVTVAGGVAQQILNDVAAFVGNNRMWQPSQPAFATDAARALLGGSYAPVVVTLARLAASTQTQARIARAKAEWIDALQRHVAARVSVNAASDANFQEHVSWQPSVTANNSAPVVDFEQHVAIANDLNAQIDSADSATAEGQPRRTNNNKPHEQQLVALEHAVQRLAEQHAQSNTRVEQLQAAHGGLNTTNDELRRANQSMHEGQCAWLTSASTTELEQLHSQQDELDNVQQERSAALSNVANLVIHEAQLRQQIVERLTDKQAELRRLREEVARAIEERRSRVAATRSRMQELQEACERLRQTWRASHEGLLRARAARQSHQKQLAESNQRVRTCMDALRTIQEDLLTNEKALTAAEVDTQERQQAMEQAAAMQAHRRDYLELRAAEAGASPEDRLRIMSTLMALNHAQQSPISLEVASANEVTNTQHTASDALLRLAEARSAQEGARQADEAFKQAILAEREHASAVEECEAGYEYSCRELRSLLPDAASPPIFLLEEPPAPMR
jgi:hypothetical protein